MRKQSGFTIVELMVATVVFSLILLAAMAAMVQIGRLYYKGITTARTQEVTRNTMSEITQAIQFSRDEIVVDNLAASSGPEIAAGNTADGTGFFCIGPRRYTYVLDRKLVSSGPNTSNKESRHALWVDSPAGGCAQNSTVTAADLDVDNPCADPTDCSNGRELLRENMRLSRLQITPDTNESLWKVDLSLAFGDDVDQDDGPLTTENGRRVCLGGSFVVQFCAISEISTSVLRRL